MSSLVLLPGLDGTGTLFSPLRPHLPADCDVTVVAYPTDRVLDLAGLCDLAARAVTAAPPPRVVVAESFSGPVALRVAARAPGEIAALVLVATFSTSPVPAALRGLVRLGAGIGARVPLPHRALARLVAGRDRSLCEAAARAVATLAPAVLASRLRMLTTLDARSDLAACALPITYIAGDRDRLVGPRHAAVFAAHGARVVTVPAPHLVLQACPERAAAVIAEVVAQQAGSGRPTGA